MASFFKKAFDTLTGHSKTGVGKFFKYAYPFNGPFLVRKGFRSLKKRVMPAQFYSASSLGGSDVYGPTGSIVGRF